tara:strand:- start:46 stop:285 length:240 start_codon:yes stop_codon:yes gene_type:complete
MAVTWTVKKINVNGLEQVKFTVKSDSKSMGIKGVTEIQEDESTTDPLEDWLKAKLGSNVVSTFETDATNIDDTPPTPLS